MEEFNNQSFEEKQNMWRAFNSERTNFWISLFYLVIESLVPGIAVLLIVGDDFATSYSDNLPDPVITYVLLINVGYLIWTFLSTYCFYKLKLHKADNFTYAITFTSLLITVTLLSFAFENTSLLLLVKFVITILVGVICLTGAVFITHVLRVHEERRRNTFLSEFTAWKNGEKFNDKKNKKFVLYEEKLQAEKQHQQELLKIKERVDKKVNASLVIEAEEEYIKEFYSKRKLQDSPDKKSKKNDKIKF